MKRFLALITLLILTACTVASSEPVTPTPSPAPTTAVPTPSPKPTITHVLIPTNTPTQTPDPDATATPYLTPTPYYSMATPIAYPDVPTGYARSHTLGRDGQHIQLGLGNVYALALSPNRRHLAIGTTMGVYLYDANTFQEIWFVSSEDIPHPDSIIHGVSWSPDGSKIAVFAGDPLTVNHLFVIDAKTGERLILYKQVYGGDSFTILNYRWMQDSVTLAAGIRFDPVEGNQEETRFILFNTEDYEENHFLPVEIDPHNTVWGTLAFSPDESLMAFPYAAAGIVYVVDVSTGTLRHMLGHEVGGHSEISRIKFSPDGRMVATYTGITGPLDAPGGAPTVWIWDVQTGELLHRLEHSAYVVKNVIWAQDSSWLISIASYDTQGGEVIVWDAATGEAIRTLLEGDYNAGISLSPDEQFIVVVGGHKGTLTLFDINTGQAVQYLGPNDESMRGGTGGTIWLDNGQTFLTITNGVLARWTVDNTRPTDLFHVNPAVDWLLWSPDGTRIAAVFDHGGGIQGTIWDASTGQFLESFNGEQTIQGWYYHQDRIEIDPEASYGYSRVYDETHYSDDGLLRLTAQVDYPDQTMEIIINLWGNLTDELLYQFIESGGDLSSLAFSPDSQWLAAGHTPYGRGVYQPIIWNTSECFVSVWHIGIDEPEELDKLFGHIGEVYELSWSPDSSKLASYSADGTIIIWAYDYPRPE